jgi:hypothetical protein
MTLVASALRRPRSRLRTLAAALVAAAQFGVATFAPALDASVGAGAPTHVESQGTRLHFAHNPDDCAACLAQTLIGVASPGAAPFDAAAAAPPVYATAALAAVTRVEWRSDAARAPPALSAARSSLSS